MNTSDPPASQLNLEIGVRRCGNIFSTASAIEWGSIVTIKPVAPITFPPNRTIQFERRDKVLGSHRAQHCTLRFIWTRDDCAENAFAFRDVDLEAVRVNFSGFTQQLNGATCDLCLFTVVLIVEL